MLNGQTILFNFLRSVLLGILGAMLFFLVLNLNKIFPLLGEKALVLVTSATLIFIVWIFGYIDLLFVRLLSAKDYPNWARLFYQTLIGQIVFALCFLPLILIYANADAGGATVQLLTAVYIILMLAAYKFWQTLYSQNEVKNIDLYGVIGSLAMIFVVGIISPAVFFADLQITIAVILGAWSLVGFVITTVLGLIYFGLNNFFDLNFWHFLPFKEQSKKGTADVVMPPPAFEDSAK